MFRMTVLSVIFGMAVYVETGSIVTALWAWVFSGIVITLLLSGLKRT